MENNKRKKYNSLYMDIAARISDMSSAVRLKVGCLLVKDGNIISFGWNGTPAGWDNTCEYMEFMPFDFDRNIDPSEVWHSWPLSGKFWVDGSYVDRRYRLVTKPEVLHAEANALMKLAKTGGSTADSVLYCTHAPCMSCAKLIHQSGISSVYYRDTYRSTEGVEFLTKGGVHIEQLGTESR
jgi:dCMP deaminase